MGNKGYTLIEVLVAMAVFGIVVAGPTGLFVLALRNQNMSLALGETIDNTSYAVEYISRAIRMARKDREGACISQNYNFQNPEGDITKIRFLNYQGYCQEFYLENNQIFEKKSSDGSLENFGSGLPLTSDDLEMDNFKFYLEGEGQQDNVQPRITIVFRIAKHSLGTGLPPIHVQTTISQRNLDVAY